MKRIVFALCALFAVATMPTLHAARQKMATTQPLSGEVFITNHSGSHVVVKWQTSLSSSMQSRIHSFDVQPRAKNVMATSGVEWFKDDMKGQKNDAVYTINVQVYSANEKTLMSEKTFKKTVGKSKMFSKIPQDNLYITVEPSYGIGIAVKE